MMTRQLDNKWNPQSPISELEIARPSEGQGSGGGHSVRLVSAGSNKIAVIKAVRELTPLGLKEAKDLVESAPVIVRSGLSRAEAEKARKTLEGAGAAADLTQG